jgi:hypothetical protein
MTHPNPPGGVKQLSREAVQLRRKVIDACWDERRAGYIDKDRFVGTCPCCGFTLIVRFAGYAARADLDCLACCADDQIARSIGGVEVDR